MWQIKYDLAVPKNLGVGVDFQPWSEDDFLTGHPKSLERSPAVGDFYGTRIEIWAGFGPVRQLLRPVFSCFHGHSKKNHCYDLKM